MVTALMGAACGEGFATPTPTSPTPAQSPFVSQFGGYWNGSLTMSDVRGGECVGQDLRTTIGSRDIGTVVIAQTRTDVAATTRSETTGLVCRYQGTAGLAAFSVSTAECDVSELLFQCANGSSRVLEQVASTMTATLNGNTATGTVATWYNVFADSTVEEQRRPVAGLITEQRFTAFRR